MGGKQKIKQLIANAVPVQIKWELERTFKFLVNRNHEAASYLNISFSQEGEDLVLQRLIGIKSNGFYVDIGAHHPYRFSNTYKFYITCLKSLHSTVLMHQYPKSGISIL